MLDGDAVRHVGQDAFRRSRLRVARFGTDDVFLQRRPGTSGDQHHAGYEDAKTAVELRVVVVSSSRGV